MVEVAVSIDDVRDWFVGDLSDLVQQSLAGICHFRVHQDHAFGAYKHRRVAARPRDHEQIVVKTFQCERFLLRPAKACDEGSRHANPGENRKSLHAR